MKKARQARADRTSSRFKSFGAARHFLKIDPTERDAKLLFCRRKRRQHDFYEQFRAGRSFTPLVNRIRRTQNIVCSKLAPFAGEIVAAARTASACQYSFAFGKRET
jgi:hypothetical protein